MYSISFWGLTKEVLEILWKMVELDIWIFEQKKCTKHIPINIIIYLLDLLINIDKRTCTKKHILRLIEINGTYQVCTNMNHQGRLHRIYPLAVELNNTRYNLSCWILN